jgi:hypothetical protein
VRHGIGGLTAYRKNKSTSDATREEIMPEQHLVHVVRTILEAARLRAIESLAASPDPVTIRAYESLPRSKQH